MEDLIKKIKDSISLSTQAEEYLIAISKEKIVSKRSVLIRQGQTVDKIFFVTGGCLHSYCIDKHGKEHTLHFAIKNNWISDYIAFHGDESATLTNINLFKLEGGKSATFFHLFVKETASRQKRHGEKPVKPD